MGSLVGSLLASVDASGDCSVVVGSVRISRVELPSGKMISSPCGVKGLGSQPSHGRKRRKKREDIHTFDGITTTLDEGFFLGRLRFFLWCVADA